MRNTIKNSGIFRLRGVGADLLDMALDMQIE